MLTLSRTIRRSSYPARVQNGSPVHLFPGQDVNMLRLFYIDAVVPWPVDDCFRHSGM